MISFLLLQIDIFWLIQGLISEKFSYSRFILKPPSIDHNNYPYSVSYCYLIGITYSEHEISLVACILEKLQYCEMVLSLGDDVRINQKSYCIENAFKLEGRNIVRNLKCW